MSDTHNPPAAAGAGPRASSADGPISYVETDSFCEGCRYSLRGQVVRLDSLTGIAVARCPECGRYAAAGELATAGRLWLNRVTTFLTMAWMVVAAFLILAEAAGSWGILIGMMDETHRYWTIPGRRLSDDDAAFMALVAALVAVLGFFSSVAATVAFPHWRWWGYVLFATVRPVLIVMVMAFCWWKFWQSGTAWLVFPYAFVFLLLYGGPGLLAAFVGRPLVRVLARLLLPGKLRATLAYLWTVDRLPPPSPTPARGHVGFGTP